MAHRFHLWQGGLVARDGVWDPSRARLIQPSFIKCRAAWNAFRSLAILVILAGWLLACREAPAQTQYAWRNVSTAPPERSGAAMAYDSDRGRMVLFGGSGASSFNDTWEWDGSTWIQVATTGPDPRRGAVMAYDSVRHRTVLFGGYYSSDFFSGYGDTWEWDGKVWRQVATTGPGMRDTASMVFDSARGRVVLFGGYYSVAMSDEYTTYGDTWEWDGTEWVLASTNGPSPRFGAGMAYDTARDRVVLFGGARIEFGEPTVYYGDTWEWDGTEWHLAAAGGPSARGETGMAYDAARGRTILFGGGFPALGDTWEWDGTEWSPASEGGPSPRGGLALAYDAARGRTVLFGGGVNRTTRYGDTWEWDGSAWQQVAAGGPPPRYGAAMAYDSARNRTVLFGAEHPYRSDTWEWDGQTWHEESQTGPGRLEAAMAYDAARGRVILFGGFDGDYLGDTWSWDGNEWSQVATTGPSPRLGAAMTYDSARSRIVLFGGRFEATVYGDTWEWDGMTWEQAFADGPSARENAAMAYSTARNRAVLFGGYGTVDGFPTFLNDTWEWDGTEWWPVASSGPPPRYQSAMVYDSLRRRTILYGGYLYHEIHYDDTWEWDGLAWKLMSVNAPGQRFAAPMTHDSARGRNVLFGGRRFSEYGSIWSTATRGNTDLAARSTPCGTL